MNFKDNLFRGLNFFLLTSLFIIDFFPSFWILGAYEYIYWIIIGGIFLVAVIQAIVNKGNKNNVQEDGIWVLINAVYPLILSIIFTFSGGSPEADFAINKPLIWIVFAVIIFPYMKEWRKNRK